MTRRGVRSGLGAAIAAAALALGACSGLSTGSAVQPGLDVDAPAQPPLQFNPPPPAAGSSPADLLRGFLRAGTASDGNYDVARMFLTAAAAKAWVPDGEAVIYDSDAPLGVTETAPGTWRLSAVREASVEPDGRYVPDPPGTVATMDIGLVRNGKEWRISSLPKGFGRWVGTQDSGRLFEPYRINYLAVGTGALVPDVRWFPADHLATRLAKALLDPVPAYLKGVVTTAIPKDAGVESVPTRAGVATVDLTGLSFPADTKSRRAIWTQVVMTLAQLPDVNQVLLQNDGASLDFSGKSAGPLSPADVLPRSATSGSPVPPVLRTGTKVTQVNPQDLLVGDSDPKGGTGPRRVYADVPTDQMWLALGPGGTEVAAVHKDRRGISRWRANEFNVPVAATQLSRPSYDTRGVLWFGGTPTVAGSTAALWAVNTTIDPAQTPAAQPVDVGWLTGRRVVSVSPTDDGLRLAVVSTDLAGHHPQVAVAGVSRQKNGMPTALSDPLVLAATLTEVRDVAWIGETDLAVLGRVAGSDQIRPYIVDIGGMTTALAVVGNPTAVTTLSGQRDLVVTTATGGIYRRSGVVWVKFANGTDLAVAPG